MGQVLGGLIAHVDGELPAVAREGDVLVVVDLRDLVELGSGDDRVAVVDFDSVALVEAVDVVAAHFLIAVLEFDFLAEDRQGGGLRGQLDVVLDIDRLGGHGVAGLNVQVVLALVLLDLEAAHTLGGNLGVAELEILDVFVGDLDRLAADDHGNRELVLGAGLEDIVAQDNAVFVGADRNAGRILEVNVGHDIGRSRIRGSLGRGSLGRGHFGRRSLRGAFLGRGLGRGFFGRRRARGILQGGDVISQSGHADRQSRSGCKHHSKHFFHGIGFLLKNSFDPPAQHIRAAWNETEYIRESSTFQEVFVTKL